MRKSSVADYNFNVLIGDTTDYLVPGMKQSQDECRLNFLLKSKLECYLGDIRNPNSIPGTVKVYSLAINQKYLRHTLFLRISLNW